MGKSDNSTNESSSLNESIFTNDTSSLSDSSLLNKTIVSPAKKSLGYLFMLESTKKNIEKLEKSYLLLADKFVDIKEKIQDKKLYLDHLNQQYRSLIFDGVVENTLFKQSLLFYHIDDLSILFDQQAQQQFLDNYSQKHMQSLKDFSSTLEKKDQFSDDEILDKTNETIEILFSQIQILSQNYANLESKKALELFQKKQVDSVKKELLKLKDQFILLQKQLDNVSKDYVNINTKGFLNSYMFFGPKVLLENFVTNTETYNAIEKIIYMYKNKQEFTAYGVDFFKSILFFGLGKTGKTYAANILSSELDRKMYHIKAHDLFSEENTDPNEMLYTILHAIIENAQIDNEPCIVFFDELEKIIDSVGKYNANAQKIISNTIIKNIVDIKKSDLDIIIVAALENKSNIDIDFGFFKENIFDTEVPFTLPDIKSLQKIFEYYVSSDDKGLFSLPNYDDFLPILNGSSVTYIKKLISQCKITVVFNRLQGKPDSVIDKDFLLSIHNLLQNQYETKFFGQKHI